MSIEYLELSDYIAIAVAVTGLDLQTVINVTDHNLAEAAVLAIAAGEWDERATATWLHQYLRPIASTD